MLESDLIAQIRAYVLANRGLIYKLSPSGLNDKGLPDLIGGLYGLPFAIETKVHPNKPTRIQVASLERFKSHGYRVGVVYALDEFIKLMEI